MNIHREAGFTLIELLIVTIIVGILGTLVATTYSGVQAENRNDDRQANIKTLQSYLEEHYAVHSAYPTFANLSDPAWRQANLKGLPTDALRDPQWNKDVTACTAKEAAVPSATPIEKCYAYQVTSADGSACDNSEALLCAQYTLTAIFEGGDKYVKASLN